MTRSSGEAASTRKRAPKRKSATGKASPKNAREARAPKGALALQPRAYEESIGAHAMADTERNIAERNHYNYVDVELRSEQFAALSPTEHAALKHHAAILLYGMRQWSDLADHLRDTAAILRADGGVHNHPFWIGMFRHAHAANEISDGDQLVADCFGFEESIDAHDWLTKPEAIRAEFVLYRGFRRTDIPACAQDLATLRTWFPTADFLVMTLLGLAVRAARQSDISRIKHYTRLLDEVQAADRAVSDLLGATPARYLFADLKSQELRLASGAIAAEEFLASFWADAIMRSERTTPDYPTLLRLKKFHANRVANARAGNLTEAERAAFADWRAILDFKAQSAGSPIT